MNSSWVSLHDSQILNTLDAVFNTIDSDNLQHLSQTVSVVSGELASAEES